MKAKRKLKSHHTFRAALTTGPDKIVTIEEGRIVINVGQWLKNRPYSAKRVGGCVVIEQAS